MTSSIHAHSTDHIKAKQPKKGGGPHLGATTSAINWNL